MSAAGFRVGVRVPDVSAAARFYRGLGFTEVGAVPGPDDVPVMVMLAWADARLILDALVGMPFPDSERERLTQHGPRGLGVAIGITVADRAALDGLLAYCRGEGCAITAEPADQPWGDRVFEFVDPYGYVWEVAAPVAAQSSDDVTQAFAATSQAWFPGK